MQSKSSKAEQQPDATSCQIIIESYEQLLAINQRLMQHGSYEMAYHALMAAMEGANQLQNEQWLNQILEIANDQRDLIDRTAPGHRMSTQVAIERGGQNLYDLMIRQTKASLDRIQHIRNQEQRLANLSQQD